MTADAPDESATRRRGARPKLLATTNRDIARLAQVSVVTVSRYFNSPELVSEGVRARLREVIAQTGYVPSQVARRLASSKSGVVGAVMQNIGSPTFARVVQGITEVVDRHGLQLLLASSDYLQHAEARAIRTFLGWHPSALILTRGDHAPDIEALLRGTRVPVVEAWDLADDRPFHQVGFRQRDAGALVARHFLEQGVRHARYVLPASAQDSRATRRGEGFVAAMRAGGADAACVRADEADDFAAGEAAIAAFAAEPPASRPRALAFANDNMAMAALLRAPAHDVQVPRDCGVAGYGDALVAPMLSPALTTVRPDPYAIGAAAAHAALRLMQGGADSGAAVARQEVPCTLVARASSTMLE
ncbi:LacI family DNA-binding transcriptional regulator [Achromobacter aloeverae]|uniref:LacI family transcriptional regulator n=1 Tax=Achromobacter aloeverae TaxID=1750518 RepID=A0A4Q1HM69_9BURK|nr:LacI family DNA-binding transcriptional regulator [Achromobacter aloeverae]RXN91591.1 LacI family transcriptional regulator [Achromobacter aloeverae]